MQQVNLYLEEFRKTEPSFSAAVILIFCGYLIFIGSAVGIILYGLTVREMRQQLQLAQQADYWEQQLNIAFSQNPEPKIDQSLVVAIEGYEARVRRNNNVLMYLKNQKESVENQSFSIYLLALTWIKQDDLWLTSIGIKKGGKSLTLSGYTLQADALPEYLKKLADLDVFKNMEFEVFDLIREEPYFKFKVSSEREENAAKGLLESISSKN